MKVQALQLSTLLLMLGGMLPPISCCWDEALVPKWTMCMLAVIVLLNCAALCGSLRRQVLLSCLFNASVAAVAMEAAFVASEMAIEPSRVWGFGACGTFDNPAGLSLHLCLSLALFLVLGRRMECTKWRRRVLLATVGLSVLCLFLTRSRTGLFSLMLLAICWMWTKFKSKGIRISLCLVALALAIALTYCKSQSTSGRRFILARSLNLIAHHPIIGNGTGGFDRNYMLEQASFFQQNPQDPHGMLADDVHHPLSEFVYAWVEHGVGGAVLLASCIVYCHARAFSLCMLPFLLFSYPLNYPLAWVVLLGNTALRLHKYVGFLPFKTNGVAMNVISCVAFAIWLYFLSLDIRMSMANNSAKMKAHSHAVRKYSSLEAEMSLIPAVSLHQKRFSCYLYNYTYELFQARRFESAWHLYEQGRGHFASYDSELLAGDILYQQALQSENHEAMIDNAAIHYELARCMCPVRFAPLEGLMRLYSLDTSNSHKADSVARLIIAKPIKVPSATVSRIKEKAIERINRRQHDISDQTE